MMNMKQRFKGGSLPNVNMSQNPMAMQVHINFYFIHYLLQNYNQAISG